MVLKPGGVLTQAPPGIDSLELRVKCFLKRRDHREGRIYLGVPHRLDWPVAGVMLLAKTRKAARRLSEQFAARRIKKSYWAIVAGRVDPPEGTWTDYLRKVPGEARSEIVDQQHSGAQRASCTTEREPCWHPARCSTSSWKPGVRTRSECSADRGGTRSSGTNSTVRLWSSARRRRICESGGSHCWHVRSNSTIRRPGNRSVSNRRCRRIGAARG